MPTLGHCELDEDGRKASIRLHDDSHLTLHLAEAQDVGGAVSEDGDRLIANFNDGTRLEVTKRVDGRLEFLTFAWFVPESGVRFLKDTLFLGSPEEVQWFGGACLLQQSWPLLHSDLSNKGYDFCEYVVLDTYTCPASGHERYWLCSKKASLAVPSYVPLWTKLSANGYLTLQAQIENSRYAQFPCPPSCLPFLSYTVCVATEAMPLADFHLMQAKTYLGHPVASIDELLIDRPIWTTWDRYGKGVTQANVLEFAHEIHSHGFSVSQIELDDKWTTQYGDFGIDEAKFPDFAGLVRELEGMEIRLTVWIHPFVNLESENAHDPRVQKLFVKDADGKPGRVHWWNGEGYAVDFTCSEARNWFRMHLKELQQKGIYTFKFDAGEVFYLPEGFRLTNGSEPNDYSRAYAHFAAEFGCATENRVASGSQTLPLLIRTLDRLSRWCDTGLQTLIPAALHFSLHGYFWNLPDIIGGNGYEISEIGAKKVRTDSELFVRWVQANAFLLVMQFSFCPWDYVDTEQVVAVVRDTLAKRALFLPYLKQECRKAVQSGVPVIRPLWWLLESPTAFLCDDQFLVGDRLLVAPVVRERQVSRTVLLPAGRWRDDEGTVHVGPAEVRAEVPLERVPYFWLLLDEEEKKESSSCTVC